MKYDIVSKDTEDLINFIKENCKSEEDLQQNSAKILTDLDNITVNWACIVLDSLQSHDIIDKNMSAEEAIAKLSKIPEFPGDSATHENCLRQLNMQSRAELLKGYRMAITLLWNTGVFDKELYVQANNLRKQLLKLQGAMPDVEQDICSNLTEEQERRVAKQLELVYDTSARYHREGGKEAYDDAELALRECIAIYLAAGLTASTDFTVGICDGLREFASKLVKGSKPYRAIAKVHRMLRVTTGNATLGALTLTLKTMSLVKSGSNVLQTNIDNFSRAMTPYVEEAKRTYRMTEEARKATGLDLSAKPISEQESKLRSDANTAQTADPGVMKKLNAILSDVGELIGDAQSQAADVSDSNRIRLSEQDLATIKKLKAYGYAIPGMEII